MSDQSLMKRAGFTSDPFATWDSDREEQLADYFVPPPYFPSILGDASRPEPAVIFAPRGTGKSALRRMLEASTHTSGPSYLALAYTDFDWVKTDQPTVEEHQLQICRLITTAILTEIDSSADQNLANRLDAHEKLVLKTSTKLLLSTLNSAQLRTAINSVKNFHDKASDLWKKYGGVAATLVGALMAKAGLDNVSVDQTLISNPADLTTGAKDLLRDLIAVARTLGWDSVYILVDRVDETSNTIDNPKAAYNIIRSLVNNLPTLEQPGIGFKFFLWDQTEELFRTEGGRPDRVFLRKLKWSVNELSRMLTERLKSFSDQKITSFNTLMSDTANIDSHLLICYIAHGSPRDMIRIAKSVIAEATRAGNSSSISRVELIRGICDFSNERTEELFPKIISDLARVPGASFTTPKLANDVFRISSQAMRQKILQWVSQGAVSKVSEQPTGINRPLHVYAFTDPRLILRGKDESEAELRLDNFLVECHSCSEIAIGSEIILVCSKCGSSVSATTDKSLLQIVTQ